MSFKRKSPYGSASPAPGLANSRGVSIKSEPDLKRARGLGSIPSSSHFNFSDPRTVVLELRDYLKERITLRWSDAFFHVQEKSPGVDPADVLEKLKKMERVKYNEVNEVFTYEPEIVLRTQGDLRSHIRTNTTWEKTHGVPYKAMRELVPQGVELTPLVEELERDGQILILRSLTGRLKDAPLPELGRENGFGERLNAGGPERWRTIFWDDLKERNRTAPRAEDEFIFAWSDVRIAETDDVAKLLEGQDLKASSVAAGPVKKEKEPEKKKKKRGRALKITNTHMKDYGIDFSQDYEAPS